ncbi:hypothetical protein EDC04DRAFT_361332 [Pisolithus marmoratus]|nr:hypothetical protein EDC04DRAFT_361332 [Pisolithus marmoratus]
MSRAFEITPAMLYDVWLQKATVLAGYTWLVYDYFLTLDDEVEYIWNAPWTPVRCIYSANRYIVLLGQTLVCIQATGVLVTVTGGCEVYAIFLCGYILVSLETAHVVLRAWAICGGNRRVLWSVILGYIVCLISLVVAVAKGEDFSNLQPTVMSVCREPTPDRAWLFYLGCLVVDSLLFCITTSGLWSYRKTFKNGSPELIQVLMRNVTAFYIVNVFYDVLGIVSVTRFQNSPTSFGVSAITTPALAICTQRVVHDLRRMAPVSWSDRELSQMVDQQLGAFPPCSKGADEGASMVMEGSSGTERERKFEYQRNGHSKG